MATIRFTIDEALRVLRANRLLPEAVRDARGERDGLRLTVAGGIDIQVRRESCAGGVLRLAVSSANLLYQLADRVGKVDEMIDTAIRPYPFARREGKTLVLDLNSALRARIQGMQVRDVEFADGAVRVDFA